MSKLNLIKIADVEVSKINMDGEEVYYDDKPLMIVTDYRNVFYTPAGKFSDNSPANLSTPIDENDKLYEICKKIDELVSPLPHGKKGKKSKYSPLIKTYEKDDTTKIVTRFKLIENMCAFKNKSEVKDLKTLCKECDVRIIFKCGRFFDHLGHYGVGLKCIQLQGKEKEKETYDECMFE